MDTSAMTPKHAKLLDNFFRAVFAYSKTCDDKAFKAEVLYAVLHNIKEKHADGTPLTVWDFDELYNAAISGEPSRSLESFTGITMFLKQIWKDAKKNRLGI